MRNRPARRRANAQERKFLPKGCTVVDVDLSDPNLAPEHRDGFITAIKCKVAQLDEQIAGWYRHRGECNIEGCDCGGNDLAKQAGMMCNHLRFIKDRFGETLIDGYPYFNRFVKEGLEPVTYETLASSKTQ